MFTGNMRRMLLLFLTISGAASDASSSIRATLITERQQQQQQQQQQQEEEEEEQQQRQRHQHPNQWQGRRLGLTLEPFPDVRTRSTFAAMLDIKWCGESGGWSRCDSLAQLWAPTLAQDVFRHNSSSRGASRILSDVATSWDLPYIDCGGGTQGLTDCGGAGGCWLEAEAVVFHRATSEPLITVSQKIAWGTSLHPKRAAFAASKCIRPRFRYPSVVGRKEQERLWLSTSFETTSTQWGGGHLPFDLYSHASEMKDETSIDSVPWLHQAANEFVSAITVTAEERGIVGKLVESEALEQRRTRTLHRRQVAVCLEAHRGRLQEIKVKGPPTYGLRVVLGGGVSANEGCSKKNDTWITTDVNTLDVTDRRDWQELGLLPALSNSRHSEELQYPILMLAEHILEHLPLPQVHSALANIAASLSYHGGSISSSSSSSRIRIAVPDADGSEIVGSKGADIQDWHYTRFTAWSLCDALRAHGLNGRLLEWHYPAAVHSAVISAFPDSPRVIKTNESSRLGYVVGRVHDWGGSADMRGHVKRSRRGGDKRGAVSLVVDASLSESPWLKESSGLVGDSCHLLLRSVEASDYPGRWSYDIGDARRGEKGADEVGHGESTSVRADRQLSDLRTLIHNYTALEEEAGTARLHWLAITAASMTIASAGAHIQSLAANAQEGPYDERSSVAANRAQTLVAASEAAWCELSERLLLEGQTLLALKAVQRGLRYGNGPLSATALSLLAKIVDTCDGACFDHHSLLKSPKNGQIFDTESRVPLSIDLTSFEESHPNAANQPDNRTPASHSGLLLSPLERLATRPCISISYIGESHKNDEHALQPIADPPLATCVQAKSTFLLADMKSGWHELRLQMWWIPSHTPAQGSSDGTASSARFCIRGRQSIRTGRDVCDEHVHEDDSLFLPESTRKEQRHSLHFVTIVLNGMPFITHHAPVFAEAAAQLNVSWHWHVVEGAALGRAHASTPYSQRPLERVRAHDGCSVDGTSEYLDHLSAPSSPFASHLSVHRNSHVLGHAMTRGDWRKWRAGLLRDSGNSDGDSNRDSDDTKGDAMSEVSCIWTDKLQMVNTAVHAISEPGVLFQIDADELWTVESIVSAYKLLRTSAESDTQALLSPPQCIRVHCHFFVAPNLVTVTRNGYGHSDIYEWTRVWAFRPGDTFGSHAPPVLLRRTKSNGTGVWDLVGSEEHNIGDGDGASVRIGGAQEYAETTGKGLLATRGVRCFGPEGAAAAGIGFTHYAYVLKEQVRFKEHFYGYDGATQSWERLAELSSDALAAPEGRGNRLNLPVRLSDHLPWIVEGSVDAATRARFAATLADVPERSPIARNVPIVPMPRYSATHGGMSSEFPSLFPSVSAFVVVLDLVILQRQTYAPRGIARVWRSLLPLLPGSIIHELGQQYTDVTLVLLARQGTPESLVADWQQAAESYFQSKGGVAFGTTIRWAPPFDESRDFLADALAIGEICGQLDADVFLSTEYTVPLTLKSFPHRDTPNKVLLLHDMTPERYGWQETFWTVLKRRAILEADAYVAVSHATADAFRVHYPSVSADPAIVSVAHNAIHPAFLTFSEREIHADAVPQRGGSSGDPVAEFKGRVGLDPLLPYFLVVGMRLGYKNTAAFLETLSASRAPSGGDSTLKSSLFFVGGGTLGESEREANLLAGLRQEIRNRIIQVERLTDSELSLAYSGAAALVYLSIDEGFGMPIIEALASGCPVLVADIPICRELISFEEDEHGNPGLDASLVDRQGEFDISGCNVSETNTEADGCASKDLPPGIFLVDPSSARQIWRAVDCLAKMWRMPAKGATRSALAEYARGRYRSWKPLADAVARSIASVARSAQQDNSSGMRVGVV